MIARLLLAALVLLVAGCVPMPDPDIGTLEPSASTWAPPEAPRAVIVALHGFNDYKASFKEFGAYAAEHGVLVMAYDQPGFGARPDRGYWQGTNAMVAELDARIREMRERYPGTPIFVLGESMGAALAIVALDRPGAPPVDGLVLAAPAVWGGSSLSQTYRTALRIIAGAVPILRVSGRNLGILASDNVEMLEALGRDPLYVRQTRIDGIAGLVEVMDAARKAAPTLHLPMLVLLGARDQVVPPAASRSFVAELPPASCSVVTYLNGWHLLLRDLHRQAVFDDVLAWVERRPLPSGLDHPCGHRPDAVS